MLDAGRRALPEQDTPVTVFTLPRRFAVRGAGLTHRGAVRATNEDAILLDPSGRIWAVADGMGGHRLGGCAAEWVIAALETVSDAADAVAVLTDRFAAAEARIAQQARIEGAVIGATAVAALIRDNQAVLAWAGDARAYLLRGGALTRLTRDHSVVQELIDAGRLSEAQARHHPQANVVTRAVGIGAHPEFTELRLMAGDRLLLCSDGLSHVLPDPALTRALEETRPDMVRGDAVATPADAACARLLQETLAAGAPDNVSVVVVDIGV